MVQQFCFSDPSTYSIAFHYHNIMQPNTFLLDHFYSNPSLNLLVPDNPLKLQDTLRKAFKGSRLKLLLNGVSILNSKLDALFFQIHTKLCKGGEKQSVIDVVESWQKMDPKFKIVCEGMETEGQKGKRASEKIRNLKIESVEGESVSSPLLNSKVKENQLERSLITEPKQRRIQITDGAINKIVGNFFIAVNKVKNQKDQKLVQKQIQKLVDNFVSELSAEDVPFSTIIHKLQEQIPLMNLDQETKGVMQGMIKGYRRNSKMGNQHTGIILKNLLYEASSPKSAEKAGLKKAVSPFEKKQESNLPITTTSTLKITKKETESNAKIRRLKLIFQSFSLANKNRRGLTFDELTEQFNKMDLNNWMNFNKKYRTISKLGIEQVHMIFKRYCYSGVLDYSRFQKAFKDLSKQLFPEDITQAYSYFGLEYDGEATIKSKIQLPLISKSRESHQQLKEVGNLPGRNSPVNNRSMFVKNKSIMMENKEVVRQRHQNSFVGKQVLNLNTSSSVQVSGRDTSSVVVSQLKNRIKKLKTKV